MSTKQTDGTATNGIERTSNGYADGANGDSGMSQGPETAPKTAIPHPRRFSLNTFRGIRREMAAVYRLARTGELALPDACKLAYLLTTLGRLSEAELLEARLEKLERREEESR